MKTETIQKMGTIIWILIIGAIITTEVLLVQIGTTILTKDLTISTAITCIITGIIIWKITGTEPEIKQIKKEEEDAIR